MLASDFACNTGRDSDVPSGSDASDAQLIARHLVITKILQNSKSAYTRRAPVQPSWHGPHCVRRRKKQKVESTRALPAPEVQVATRGGPPVHAES